MPFILYKAKRKCDLCACNITCKIDSSTELMNLPQHCPNCDACLQESWNFCYK